MIASACLATIFGAASGLVETIRENSEDKVLKAIDRAIIFSAVILLSLFYAMPAFADAAYDEAARGHPSLASELDRTQYSDNVELLRHYYPGIDRGLKLQMIAIGEHRYLVQGSKTGESRVFDVTDPMNLTEVSQSSFEGWQIQVAYSKSTGKWLLMTGSAGSGPDERGLRGISLYDASDPANIEFISSYSADGGDPDRLIQQGSGTHRNYYDGGRYAYLDSQMNADFSNFETSRANGLQIVDLNDPGNPEFVSYTWHPGQRIDEDQQHEAWRENGDKISFTSMHGAAYVPERVEDGGLYSYSAWGSFGLKIHDVSDPLNVKLVGSWQPPDYRPALHIEAHAVNVSFLARDFVILSPEPLMPHCRGPWYDSYVLDISDKSQPTMIATLPVPQPPDSAPYDDFCDKRGRFGTHNSPHLKAPGKPHPTITAYAYFNAGLQFYDMSDPANPTIAGYFIPGQGGTIDDVYSYYRDTDNVFIEWDRKLVWMTSNTGLYLLSTPLLGDPVLEALPVTEWAAPGVNVGFEDFEQK